VEDYPIKTVPDVANWSENYALAGFDPASGIDLFLALGRWRKDLTLWREMVGIALPDGTILAHRAIGDSLNTKDAPGATNLKITIDEDGSRQTWSFRGAARRVTAEQLSSEILIDGPLEPVSFECSFISALPGWDLGSGGKASAMAGHAHLEQIGRVAMDIRVAGEAMRFDSQVNRDHSRGPRVVGKLTRHVWCHGIFENGFAFQAYEAYEGDDPESGPVFSKACVYREGRAIPASLTFGPRLPDADPLKHIRDPQTIVLRFEGEEVELVAEAFPTVIHIQFTKPWDNYFGARQIGSNPTRRLVEQSIRYRIKGGTKGYGHMERTVPGAILDDLQLT